MENHEDDNVTSYFSYDDLFLICKELNEELSKLKHLVSTFMTIISYGCQFTSINRDLCGDYLFGAPKSGIFFPVETGMEKRV